MDSGGWWHIIRHKAAAPLSSGIQMAVDAASLTRKEEFANAGRCVCVQIATQKGILCEI